LERWGWTFIATSLLYEEIGALWEPIVKDNDWSHFDEKLKNFNRAGSLTK